MSSTWYSETHAESWADTTALKTGYNIVKIYRINYWKIFMLNILHVKIFCVNFSQIVTNYFLYGGKIRDTHEIFKNSQSMVGRKCTEKFAPFVAAACWWKHTSCAFHGTPS